MTGLDLINEALALVGKPPHTLVGDCSQELNCMLNRWNLEGFAHFEPIADLRGTLSFSAGYVEAIVYNLAIRLEPYFCMIRSEPLHQAANDAWLNLVRSEESGLIDCTPGSFRRAAQYMPDKFDLELLAILHEAAAELAEHLAELRLAA